MDASNVATDEGSSPLERGFVAVNRIAIVALMAAMATLVFANVVSRYLLNYSLVWVEEVTRYMMVWVGFLGSGLVLRCGAHIAVETFQDLLPTRAARALRGFIVALLAVTFAALVWLGIRYVAFAWDQETPVLNWRTGIVYLAVPIGAALMLGHLAFIARGYVVERRFKRDASSGPEDATL
ncbi:MAG TPA: TRAP transporter small permease [Casimicrobiaceae bacterium]|nr:TRAP transporter small permease [Casimicrobiaceae bacterium]